MDRQPIFWYADDDEDDRMFLTTFLAESHPEIHLLLFSSGEQLINHIPACTGAELPCLIILDLNMPGSSGKDVFHVVRAFPKFDGTRIAILTTSGLHSDNEWAHRNGALFLTKPFFSAEFPPVINKLCSFAVLC